MVVQARLMRLVTGLSTGLIALCLAGWGAFAPAPPTPLPTVVLDKAPGASKSSGASGAAKVHASSAGGATASGVIAPAQQARIASASGGGVAAVNVVEGEVVQAGQVLVRIARRHERRGPILSDLCCQSMQEVDIRQM